MFVFSQEKEAKLVQEAPVGQLQVGTMHAAAFHWPRTKEFNREACEFS